MATDARSRLRQNVESLEKLRDILKHAGFLILANDMDRMALDFAQLAATHDLLRLRLEIVEEA